MSETPRPPAPTELPIGTITFLFSDIEGSTALLTALGDGFRDVLERHHELLRTAVSQAGGTEVATEGDAFFVVFRTAPAAVAAAVTAQRMLAAEPWPSGVAVRVRMGVHTGEGTLGGDSYVGMDVHRAARIAAAAHGGQVLISEVTRGLVARSLPQDVSLRDLGEHRLKDLQQPERLAQLVVAGLSAEFPPPRTLETPSNLPPELTSFVGREREVAEVTALLDRSRLVTLTGPGGTGKTRLALRVAAHRQGSMTDGAFFVDLSAINQPELIPVAVAQALTLREEANRPMLDTVAAYLRDREMLLVLDNFEQVVAGAPVVTDLQEVASRLAILVTSREVLHVRGEQEYAVPPLGVPRDIDATSPASVERYDALALFIDRAWALRSDMSFGDDELRTIAAICARLDGLPLAIELAAARTNVLSLSEVLDRLGSRLTLLAQSSRDLPDRQRTLRGAIDWSYELLTPPEQRFFARLGIFTGGWTVASAEAVCNRSGDLGLDVLDGLGSLIDKSLVRRVPISAGPSRFTMLETIREFALERLEESGEASATRQAHQDFFTGLAPASEAELIGPRRAELLDSLDAERDNLRAALLTAGDDGRIGLALDKGAVLWRFWQQRSHLAEGRSVLEALLARPDAAGPTAARAHALGGLGGILFWQGDLAAAERAYGEALEIERSVDDPAGLAEALYNAGFVAGVTGDLDGAQPLYEESLRIFTDLKDQAGIVKVREVLVVLMFQRGDWEHARELQERNVADFRAGGPGLRLAYGLNLLSLMQFKTGHFADAHAGQAEAMATFLEAGDTAAIVRTLIFAADLAVAEGEPERGARLTGAMETVRQPLGEIATPMQLLHMDDPAVVARQALGDDVYTKAFNEGRALTLDEAVALMDRGA